MLRTDFKYDLPEAQIAIHPCEVRSASRLLRVNPDTDVLLDAQFADFPALL